MNAIYKVIWNDALRLYQVVNEMCRSRRKACSVKAVHTERTSDSATSSLKIGAALVGAIAVMGAGMTAYAEDLPLDFVDGTFDTDGGTLNDPLQFGLEDVPNFPTSNQFFVLNGKDFRAGTSNVSSQDSDGIIGNLLQIPSRDYLPNGKIKIVDDAGAVLYDGSNEASRFGIAGSDANLYYKFNVNFTGGEGNSLIYTLNRELTRIDLTGNQSSQYGLVVFGGEADETSSNLTDLDVAITGTGDIQFAFTNQQGGEDANMGYLYLNTDSNILDDGVAEEQASTYTGKTYVGNVGGDPNGKAVTVIFGKNNAFGSTSNLYIHDDSSVWFADKDLKTRHTQTVGGLTGEGELNFGNAAEVTLKQTSTGNGYTDTDNGVVRVDNAFTGASANGGGAVFNIDLSELKLNTTDPVRGSDSVYEIFFTDQPQKDEYTGLITLTGGAVTAYNKDHSQNFNGVADPYTNLNGILLGSTLQLKQDGWVRVDSRGELNNLIIDSGAGGIDFSNLGNVVANGEGALTINGNLTFSGADATVSIKDFNYNIGEAAAGMDLIDADEGLRNTLVHVEGDVVGEENYGFVLEESQQKPVVSEITDDSGTTVASGTWVFEDELDYDDSGNYDLVYKLTQVDIKEGQTLTISGSDKASEASKTQDFTAKIIGSGNIVFDAADNATGSGTRIEIGDASTTDKNDYTGSTTVTDGTTLVLTEDDAMGRTSDLIAHGNVEIGSGIEQTVKNINSSGSGTISIADSGTLTVDASGDQTINNIISGAGDLNIDLGGSDKKLVFGNSGQGSSFTGDLSLGNGRFSLDDGQNEAFAGSSSIVLGTGSVFDFGSGTSNIKDLTVNADSKLESSALVIGSDTAPHNISGSFSLNSDTTITLTGVSVETDLSLTDYDGNSVSQDFITAGKVTVGANAEISLSGAGDFVNLGNLVLDYQQTQNGSAATVAETVWTVNGSLTQNGNAFQVGTQLKEIRLIGNTILSGSGTSNELSALVTDSDTDGSHSLQFSSADGTQTSFTIVDYAGDSVFGNSYTGATTVDSNVTVTLGTNNGFGSTSLLTAQGNVTLSDGVKQTVKGLSGTGTITLGSGAELTLAQTGSASVGNILAGTGKFIVDLGAEANELSFTNSGAGAFGGTVSLSDGTVRLASGTATQTVLSGADLALDTDGRLIVSGSGTDQRELGGLTLNGNSQIDFSSVSMGDANSNNAQLYVSGSFTINGSNDVSVGGINLDGTKNILAADDDNGGLKQALVTANGGIDLSRGQLVIDLTDPLMKSEIKNSGSDKTVAYGVWTAGAGDDVFTVAGNTLYASLERNSACRRDHGPDP